MVYGLLRVRRYIAMATNDEYTRAEVVHVVPIPSAERGMFLVNQEAWDFEDGYLIWVLTLYVVDEFDGCT